MENFFGLIVMAIFVEGIVTYVKELTSKFSFTLFIPIVISIAIAVAYKLDMPSVLGINSDILYVGNVITGIAMARGSNYLYDLIGRFTNINKPAKEVYIEQPYSVDNDYTHGA